MKNNDISHWEKNEFYFNLLMFVETIDEASFSYSFESYKYPALNCHYMCFDVAQTANDIENKVLMDGNFIPISEEFELLLEEDPFIKNKVANDSLLLLNKTKNMDYYDLSKQDIKSKIREYKTIANYLIDKCEVKYSYFDYLCYSIIEILLTEKPTYDSKDLLYRLSRMFVTELINSGYSQEFVQRSIKKFFYNPEHKIICNRDTLIEFFNHFSSEVFSFKFKFIVNNQMSKVFEKLNDFEIDNLSESELLLINSQKKKSSCVIIELENIDEYSAYKTALEIIQTVLSFHNLNQHNSKLYISNKAIVEKSGENASKFVLKSNMNIMKQRGNTSYLHALFNDVLLNRHELPQTFYKAISLHNVAIDCKDTSNQLLNLWTILEILITAKRDNEDKINTICSILEAILNRTYLYSQIEQLLKDIKTCINSEQITVFSSIQEADIDDVEKLTLILALDKYAKQKEELLKILENFPLLIYRIEKFSNIVFKDSKSVYDYIRRHTKKIHWHIMRIYRNRNMIVHDGSYMPYRDLLVENLHFYVDSLFETLIQYYLIGYLDNSSIYMDIMCKEIIHYQKLGLPIKNKKKKFTTFSFSETNALELIYNGFNGNFIKKAIEEFITNSSKKNSTNEVKTAAPAGTAD